MQQRNLGNISVKDIQGAKTRENGGGFSICPAGMHEAKVVSFTETDTYNQVKLNIDGVNYGFFYNYLVKDTDQLDADLLNWMKGLATISVTDNTTFQQITNSSIGHTYKIKTYVYKAKSGKHAGEDVAAIDFKTLPELVKIATTTENAGDTSVTSDEDLPF